MKYDFSKQTKARKIMIIATCCLAIILSAFSSFTVYADNEVDLGEFYDIPSGIYPDDNSGFPWLPLDYDGVWSGTHHDYAYQASQYNGTTAFTVPQSFFVDNSIYPHYIMANNNGYLKFICLPSDCFIVGNDNNNSVSRGNICIYCNTENLDSYTLNGYMFDFSSSNPHYYYMDDLSLTYQDTQVVDGETYYKLYFNSSFNADFVFNTDVPCYYSSSLTISSTDDLENVNDNYSGGVVDGEKADNNLYFKDCDISYSCTGNTNGNIVCQAKLTDYQKEHLDEFLVVYNFTFNVKGYERLYNTDGEPNSLLGYKYNFSKNYSYQQTLSDFYNNSSSKVFTLKDIEQNINTTDIDNSSVGGFPGSEYGTLYQLFNFWNNNYNSGSETTYPPFIYQNCNIKTTMFVTLADVNLDNITDNNIRSGSYSESYNFIKGTSSLNSDGILNNSNPVETSDNGSIDSNEDLVSLTTQGGVSGNDMPSSNNGNGSGSGSGSVSGDNNIVINNNPTFNNNSNGSGSNGSLSTSGGSPSNSGLFSTLVDFVKGDTESTSESISELVDSDGWISVINSYYTFIPEKFWTLLFTVMGTCIGIMVVGFIISIVLRFIS